MIQELFSFFIFFRLLCFLVFLLALGYVFYRYVYAGLVQAMHDERDQEQERTFAKIHTQEELEKVCVQGKNQELKALLLIDKIDRWRLVKDVSLQAKKQDELLSQDRVKSYLIKQASWLSLYDAQKIILPKAFSEAQKSIEDYFFLQDHNVSYVQKIIDQLHKG